MATVEKAAATLKQLIATRGNTITSARVCYRDKKTIAVGDMVQFVSFAELMS